MPLLSLQETLKETGIARATLYRLIDEGLPFDVIGVNRKMFNLDKVNEFIAMRRNSIAPKLLVGHEYTNEKISQIFKCSTQGGMRRSHSTLALVLTSHHDDPNNAYIDYWQDDIFYYTGMGMEGDQSLDYAQNKTLANSNSNGVIVYLFEVFSSGQYTYRGIVKLIAEPFLKDEVDFARKKRKVWKFPLKLINGDLLPDGFIKKEQQRLRNNIGPITDQELLEKVTSFDGIARSRRTTTITYEYNPFVREYVFRRANGFCELCGQPAPFEVQGRPYLKTYHLKQLSKKGLDVPQNVAALCPNCYERLNQLNDKQDINKLERHIK